MKKKEKKKAKKKERKKKKKEEEEERQEPCLNKWRQMNLCHSDSMLALSFSIIHLDSGRLIKVSKH